MSQFVENFKKSRLMLVHGTGDGEGLLCARTVLSTEHLVCGREKGLAVQSQATPVKNNLGKYTHTHTLTQRQRQRDRDRESDVGKKRFIF